MRRTTTAFETEQRRRDNPVCLQRQPTSAGREQGGMGYQRAFVSASHPGIVLFLGYVLFFQMQQYCGSAASMDVFCVK